SVLTPDWEKGAGAGDFAGGRVPRILRSAPRRATSRVASSAVAHPAPRAGRYESVARRALRNRAGIKEADRTMAFAPKQSPQPLQVPTLTQPPGSPADSNAALAEVQAERTALRRQVMDLQRVCSLGVLAGGICHELNNILTPILNYAKLGQRNPDP